MLKKRKTSHFIAVFTSLALAACGGEDTGITPEEEGNATDAHVVALSTYSTSVGTLIEAYGSDFPALDQGQTLLLFDGVFQAKNGTSEPVRVEAPVRRVDGGTLRWTNFGPYNNPFSPTRNEVGTFVGTVSAKVITTDGQQHVDPNPPSITLDVEPSILVTEFQPLTASCNGAVLRGLGGASYRMSVEAIGFEPVAFTYTISTPAASDRNLSIRHLASGRFDGIGGRGDITLPPVPDGMQAYAAIITVQARDEEDRIRQNVFGLTVHRPLEVFYNGNVEVAEVLAPTPVSGCIPGAETGRNTQYTESQTETRSKNYAVSWNESWLNTHTVSAGSQNTIGLSETNGVGFSTTDGQSFRWSLGTEIGGTFGISKLVSLGVKANAEVGGERSRSVSSSANRSSGVNAASTTTETETLSQSTGQQQGESFSWQASSSQSISQGFGGYVLPGTFGVYYRQTLRLVRRAGVVAYNQCGFASMVAEVDFVDWTWSPDLALGNSCPPLPASNLPPAECVVPPCAGQ